MRYLFLLVVLFTILCGYQAVLAASGDRTPGYLPKFHNVSSSTKAAKGYGELRFDASYLYVNISTAARPHWRRVGLGASF